MGKNSHSQLYKYLRRRMLFMFGVLSLLILMIGFIYMTENRTQARKDVLIDIMGRQRMYSQIMAKEATRVSLLFSALTAPDRVEEPAVILAKIGWAKQNIMSARVAFEKTLTGIQAGQFTYNGETHLLNSRTKDAVAPPMQELVPDWQTYKEALSVIETMSGLSQETRQAMIRINSTDQKLLQETIEISDIMLNVLEDERNGTLGLFFLIFTLTLLMIYIMLYDIYRHVMLPMDHFYQKISEVGISKNTLSIGRGSIDPVLDEINEVLEGCRDIIGLIENINQKTSFYDTLRFIYDAFRKYIPYSYIGIALFDLEKPTQLNAAYGISDGTFEGLPGRLLGDTTELSETSLGAIMESMKPRIINDLEEYSRLRKPQRYTEIILEEGIRSSITLPLKAQGKVLGFIFFSSKEKNQYSERHSDFLETIVNALTISFEKNIFTDELLYSSVLALAKLAEARDEDTAVHLDRIKEYTQLLVNCLHQEGVYAEQLTDTLGKDIVRFSPMHDIGKVGIRDDVLLKPGRLTPEEFEHIKTHTAFGANVLREAEANILRTGKSMFVVGIEIAGSHHEKWDGSGYPTGAAGEAIPLSARIVALVDVFDALTTRRPYKAPFSFDDAVAIIRQGEGVHFDPRLVGVFLKHLGRFQERWDRFTESQPDVYR